MEVEMERSVVSGGLKGNEISVHDLGSSGVENNYRYFPEDPCSISEDYDYFSFSIRSLLREVRQCCLSENSLVDGVSSSEDKEDSFVFSHSQLEEMIGKDDLVDGLEEEDSFVFSHSQLEEMINKDLCIATINGREENENKEYSDDDDDDEEDLVDDYNYYVHEYSDHEYFGDDEYE
ncbi:hypothetical protein Sjap_004460 [Stephania japonica]|uniref:Uncharacterized protein n=1 Tax=Stephania japonica TaxID=461633 RepID=A0AAP0K4G1_9MAGN